MSSPPRTAMRPLLPIAASLLLGAGVTALSVSATAQRTTSTPRTSATNPPPAPVVQPFTQAERQQGQQAHAQILQEMGGAITGARADYVARVGQNIAVQSGLSSNRSDFTVSFLNSPVYNAFALPGGYIYVTRQLTALMNNEAELAGVLGHELGHTVARHAQARQRRETRNSIIGILGQVLGGAIGDNGGLLGTLGGALQRYSGTAAQLLTLSYSRSQETEADDLGITYLARAGYDPYALSTVLASLAAQNDLDASLAGRAARAIPAWASTHPDPASRVLRARAQAARTGITNGRTNRDIFLTAINGVMFGDDPRQGVIEGQSFLHPDLRLGFSVPNGFGMANGAAAVSITGNGGEAQFTRLPGNYSGNLDNYVRQVFQSLSSGNGSGSGGSGISSNAIQRTTINGMPVAYATATANGQQGQVDVTVFAYDLGGGTVYHFAALTPVGGARVFDPMFSSFHRLSASEVAGIRARRLDVVTVPRGATMAMMAQRMAYGDYQLERFAVLNGLATTATLTPGSRVKIVSYAPR